MKSFWSIAPPHRDILDGRLNIDTFAADLWEVFKGRATEEYTDKDIFFRKTFITAGLENLLNIAEKRLKGEGGEAVIQLQTPFGGGKTHSLIALYHKAKDWGANVIVISGDKLSVGGDEPTLWEILEKQLDGKIEKLKGKISPGGERLRELLQKGEPLLLLFDEIHAYVVKASGIKVENSNLASQTLLFLQELTSTVKNLKKTILFISLPSSDPYRDEKSEELLQSLQNILGRVEKIHTPVQDEEISEIIKRRLFNEINLKEAKKIIEEFLDYADKEKILPEGVEKAEYREKFLKTYPFQPEVIDVLYKRWGSFPTFQRTRGILRFLSLVVYSLRNSNITFIRLSDIDLSTSEIREELIKYIGHEYESVISSDITAPDSGAKKVDKSLGDAYISYSFGTKVTTTIFMYSFSGGPEKGATLNEIKLSCAIIGEPSSIITDAVEKLKEHLFYLSDMGIFFTNQPNLNRILLIKMENITQDSIEGEEHDLLRNSIEKKYFDVYIWPNNSRDIPDTTRLKLIVLKDSEKLKDFLDNYGDRPRIYRNTLIFLCPLDSERVSFNNFMKKKLAYSLIEKDKTLLISDDKGREVKDRLRKMESQVKDQIKSLYRLVFIPIKDEFKEIDLGIPTHGEKISIDKEIYERLRSEGEILESLSHLILESKYLNDKDYVETKNIFEAFYKTPGEIRITRDEVLKESIKKGVKEGLFGVGRIEDGKPLCRYFKEDFEPKIEEGEIIIRRELCKPETKQIILSEEEASYKYKSREPERYESNEKREKGLVQAHSSSDQEKSIEEKHERIRLKLNVPAGKISTIAGMINIIRQRFNTLNIIVEIYAEDGTMTITEYEDKIKETIYQSGIIVEEEQF